LLVAHLMFSLATPCLSLSGRGFSLSEDRFLLYWCRLLGYGEWSKLRSQIRKDAEFRFDYFLKSRSCAELNRRVDALLRSMQKEEAKQQSRRASRKGIAATTTAAGSASASAHRPDPSSTPLPLSRELFATSGGSRPLSTQVSPSPSPVMFHARQPAAPLSSSGSLADDAIPSAADEDRPLGVKRRSLLHADHDDEGEHDEHAQEADGDVDMPQVEDPAEDLPLVHRQKVLKAMQRLEASRSNF
jgi:hypothetical protein